MCLKVQPEVCWIRAVYKGPPHASPLCRPNSQGRLSCPSSLRFLISGQGKDWNTIPRHSTKTVYRAVTPEGRKQRWPSSGCALGGRQISLVFLSSFREALLPPVYTTHKGQFFQKSYMTFKSCSERVRCFCPGWRGWLSRKDYTNNDSSNKSSYHLISLLVAEMTLLSFLYLI